MKIVLPAREIDAIEWTGANLRDVQDFVAPHSPYLAFDATDLTITAPSAKQLAVPVADHHSRALYSYNAKARTMKFLTVGDRIVRHEGSYDLDVITKAEWEQMVPPEPAALVGEAAATLEDGSER